MLNLSKILRQKYKKLMVTNLTSDFRAATEIQNFDLKYELKSPNNVLIKNQYVGINASDINFTSGKYYPGKKPPFNVGFEAVGQVVESASSPLPAGTNVAYCFDGSFSEYSEVPVSRVYQIPEADPAYVGLLVSGMTAKLAIDELSELEKYKNQDKKQNILVTAAAGGTGHLFAQLAKLANPSKNTVYGTTSSSDKADWLENYCQMNPINLSQVCQEFF